MGDGKDFFASKATWGVLVPIINMLAKQAGFDLGELQPWVDGFANLTGAVLFLWGQFSRVKRITTVAGLPVTKE